MEASKTQRVEIVVQGQVQGVFFRAGVKDEAERLNLVGWVRNEPDGSVRITATGEEENLQKLVEWCKKGTKWAGVEKVNVNWQNTGDEFKNFEIQ